MSMGVAPFRQVPVFSQGQWYPDHADAVTANTASSNAGLIASAWPEATIYPGWTLYFLHTGAGLYDSQNLKVAAGAEELTITWLDLATGSAGEYHVLEIDPQGITFTKYLDPGLGNVTQNGNADAFRSRLIIAAPIPGIRIDMIVASGVGDVTVAMVTAR